MQSLKILLLSILVACGYGIAHDQVTARVCVEYFTVGHPPIFGTTSPTLLAIGWGIIATWWVGAPLGILLAMAARAGKRHKLAAADLLKPLGVLLLIMAICSLAAGIAGHRFAQDDGAERILSDRLLSRLPPDRHAPFVADLFAHTAAYLVGAIGGLCLCIHTLARRVLRIRRDLRSIPLCTSVPCYVTSCQGHRPADRVMH